MLSADELASIYMDVKEGLLYAGYETEIDWQAELSFEDTTEPTFLKEGAWVIVSTGFRESVVSALFGRLTQAFLCWRSARAIVSDAERCRERAVAVFAHRRKIDAIVEMSRWVAQCGFEGIREGIEAQGVGYLEQFPYIGPVTSYHLAKNIGMDVVKPDRHLRRMALASGYGSPREMCATIGHVVGDSLRVVDLVLWRYATLDGQYLQRFMRNA